VPTTRWPGLGDVLALEWLPSAARAAALFALIAASIAIGVRLAFSARVMPDLLLKNQLEPGQRQSFYEIIVVSALVAGISTLIAAVAFTMRRRPSWLERAAWFLSPLTLLGVVPMVLRHDAWLGRALDLLLTTALIAIVAEWTTRRALQAAPSALVQRASELRRKLPSFARTHLAPIAVCLAALAYSVFMTKWTIIRHHRLQSAVFDLGISDNLMYNALAGNFMKARIFSGAEGGVDFLANHFQVGQYIILPIYALKPEAETLLGVQSFALGLSAILLYGFSRRRLTPWVSAIVAIGFLAYPPMHGANFYEMTYLPVACPFIIATFWALDAGRYRAMIPMFIAALLMREDISFDLAIIATGFVFANHRTRAALCVAFVSATYFAVVRFVVMPKLGTWCFPDLMYRQLIPAGEPSTFGSVIKTLVTNPLFALSRLATEQKLTFALHLLVPVAFLPLRRAWLLLALLPGAVTTLLTTAYAPTVSLGFHYTMHWAPFIWLAVPAALSVIGHQPDGSHRVRAALVALVLATTISSYNFGAFSKKNSFQVGFGHFDFRFDATHRQRYSQLMTLVKMLPRNASVSLTERVGAHASNRVDAYAMRKGPQGADFVLAGQYDLGVGSTRKRLIEMLD